MTHSPNSRRWIIPWTLFVSLTIAYLDRMNISYAMSHIAHDFGWTVEEVGRKGGMLMSLFFVGYGTSNIFLTPIAERFGARRSLLVTILFFSTFTILGAPASASFALFAATRLMLGLSEGAHYPMMAGLTKHWFPPEERSRANSLWTCGILVATIGAPFVLLPLIESFGWRAMLVIVGGLGLLLSWPAVFVFVHDSPAQSPWLRGPEKEWLAGRLAEESSIEEPGDWTFLRNPSYWLTIATGVLHIFFSFGIVMWLPTYLTEGRGLPIKDLQWAATAPIVAGLLGVAITAWLGDRLGARAWMAGIGYLFAGLFAWTATHMSDVHMTVFFLSLAGLAQGAFISQEVALVQRIVPHRVISRGFGIYNGCAILIGGGIGQWLIGEVIAFTGNYTSGVATVTFAAAGASVMLLILSQRLRY